MLKRIIKRLIDGMSQGMTYGMAVVSTGGGDGLSLYKMF